MNEALSGCNGRFDSRHRQAPAIALRKYHKTLADGSWHFNPGKR
jgi:hypothetical protein